MNFRNKVTRHLTVKLIFVVFMVIIPVNIIAVILVSMVSESYVDRLKDFLNMDSFTQLTLDSETDSTVRQVRLNNKISEIRNTSTLAGMSYTWDPAKGIISISSVSSDISLESQEKIRQLFIPEDPQGRHRRL